MLSAMSGGRRRTIGTVAVAVALCAPAAARAKTLEVAASNPGCATGLLCQTVAEARAHAVNGDTINVHAGTYAATSVDFGALAGITLQGAGDGVPRLEGPADTTVLTLNHSFTLRNIAVIASGTGTALFALSKNNEADPKAVTLDDAILGGGTGANGTGLLVRTLNPAILEAQPGDITITADHVTIAGAPRAIRAEAQANGGLTPAGLITVNTTGSVVHGSLTQTDCSCVALNPPMVNVGASNEINASPGGTFFRDQGAGRDYRLRVDGLRERPGHRSRRPAGHPATDVEGDAWRWPRLRGGRTARKNGNAGKRSVFFAIQEGGRSR